MIKLANKANQAVVETVYSCGQGHVFRWWDELSLSSQEKLINQLRQIDSVLLGELKEKCLKKGEDNFNIGSMEQADIIPVPVNSMMEKRVAEARQIGEEAIGNGRVAAFLVAGGQGTRLGFEGPKGMFPIGPVTGKSLFQMHAEKIRAACEIYGVSIPWYIMTSETNHETTVKFFNDNNFFSLPESDLFFLSQRMLPALDFEGRLILDAKDHIFTNPNGHGGALLALYESGAVDDMHKRGVKVLSYFQVDNLLIKVVDPVFIGYHIQCGAEMSSKMLKKKDPMEKLGVFGRIDGKLRVIEYSDMKEKEMRELNSDGSLKYGAGSIAIHLLNVSFVESEVREGFKLPYHVARKKIPCINDRAELIFPTEPNGYKFETFIFDALMDTTKSVIMEVVREEEFSPVKNMNGGDSPETAKRDLVNMFGQWLEEAGIHVSRDSSGNVKGLVEISPLFAFERVTFLKKVQRGIRFDHPLYFGHEG
jgi:UDP-N-acetylglucosamine/UDP-N-acetylgalactosamine diphosphorylase